VLDILGWLVSYFVKMSNFTVNFPDSGCDSDVCVENWRLYCHNLAP